MSDTMDEVKMEETENASITQNTDNDTTDDNDQTPHVKADLAHQTPPPRALARRIEDAPTLPQKAELLWALPTAERHAALGELNADLIAAIIENQPEDNTALLGNLPATKFSEIVNIVPPEQGRRWLERAVTSGHLAAQMLPSLMNPRDLMPMIMTSPDVRRALPRLLNFKRAEEMRTLLHPLEWKTSLDDLLLADAEELLKRAPIKNKHAKAVLQSLLDFFPELYLETIRLALDYAKYAEDHPEELADLTEMPFDLPSFLTEAPPVEAVAEGEGADPPAPSANGHHAQGSAGATGMVPATGDPFLSLATSRLPEARREQLEEELKKLLRQEIVASGSFAQADLMRAAGRLLFGLRAGLAQVGGNSPETAAHILETRSLSEVALLGARVAERYRQRSLGLSGYKDWLDSQQKQFLAAMKTPEAGMNPETGEPALYLAKRPSQPREEWTPTSLAEVDAKLESIGTWASLARAAFGSPARVQTIFATAKTKTAEEAARRMVVALCLYRRWEPELVRPGEDYAPFRRQFSDSLGRLNPARQVVLEALDKTPDDAWKPADAKEKARAFLLNAVDELERPHKDTEK